MIEPVGRRPFLIGAVLALGAWHTPAAAANAGEEDQDWKIFERMVNLFVSITTATNILADGITTSKFTAILNKMDTPLAAIIRAKTTVFTNLDDGTCRSSTVARVRVANNAAQSIRPLLRTLSQDVSNFEAAIKPGGTRDAAAELAVQLTQLEGLKFWIDNIGGFCGRSVVQRQELLRDVQRGIKTARNARKELGALLDRIG